MRPIYNPEFGPMRIAGFMSGSGTNIVKLLEYQREHPGTYEVAVLFTDRPAKSNARTIAKDFSIPLCSLSSIEFSEKLGLERKTDRFRKKYDEEIEQLIAPYFVDAIALGGYMRILSHNVLPAKHIVFNVHPADLSIMDEGGKRKYTGDAAVQLAMDAQEPTIRATTHLITPQDVGVDSGPILFRSAPLTVDYALSADENQKKLKEAGDWLVFPKTAEYLAIGRFSWDKLNRIFFDGAYVPNGKALEEIE